MSILFRLHIVLVQSESSRRKTNEEKKETTNYSQIQNVRSSLMSSVEQRRVARIGLSVDVLSFGGVRVCDVCR